MGIKIWLRSLALGLAVLGLLLVPYGASGKASSKDAIPAGVRAELLKDARSAAAKHKERRPFDIQAVLTTERQAHRLEDETRPGAEKLSGKPTRVYLIAMEGRFTFICEGPRGTPADCQRPPVLMLMVSVSTKEVLATTEWGEKYPNLESVGVPVHLGAPKAK